MSNRRGSDDNRHIARSLTPTLSKTVAQAYAIESWMTGKAKAKERARGVADMTTRRRIDSTQIASGREISPSNIPRVSNRRQRISLLLWEKGCEVF
jgi:hypothetical protein